MSKSQVYFCNHSKTETLVFLPLKFIVFQLFTRHIHLQMNQVIRPRGGKKCDKQRDQIKAQGKTNISGEDNDATRHLWGREGRERKGPPGRGERLRLWEG